MLLVATLVLVGDKNHYKIMYFFFTVKFTKSIMVYLVLTPLVLLKCNFYNNWKH